MCQKHPEPEDVEDKESRGTKPLTNRRSSERILTQSPVAKFLVPDQGCRTTVRD
jgi:hypothetical protein